MKFSYPLIPGVLIKRYKRFLADIQLSDGSMVTAHTPNTGAMTGCNIPGSRVYLFDTCSASRKYPLSWEMVEDHEGYLVGINTHLSNRLVREAIELGDIPELKGYDTIQTEIRYGTERSRIDLLLQDHPELPDCYVEVKNVTLIQQKIAYFPDAVSVRASKHLRELVRMVKQGYRAVVFFCIQRSGVEGMSPADHIDPEYGKALRFAIDEGVEVMAFLCDVSTSEIVLTNSVDVQIPVLE